MAFPVSTRLRANSRDKGFVSGRHCVDKHLFRAGTFGGGGRGPEDICHSQRSFYKKCLSGAGPLLVLFYTETVLRSVLLERPLWKCGSCDLRLLMSAVVLRCCRLRRPAHSMWSSTTQGQSLTLAISYKGRLRPPPPNFAKVPGESLGTSVWPCV